MKRKIKNYLQVVLESIEYTDRDTFLIKYFGYYKGEKVLEGVYEVDEMPKLEGEVNNKILKEIEAVVKSQHYGVKH